LFVYGSDYNILANNTVIGGTSAGIYTLGATGNTLINNNATSDSAYAIIIADHSYNNTLINNTGECKGSGGQCFGMWINLASDNNTLINNTAKSNDSYAFVVAESSNNSIINQIAIGSWGIQISNSNNTIFRDCINITGKDEYDVHYDTAAGSINNTFINCSYNTSKESVNGAANQLIRKWYYKAYVNYSNSTPVYDANVTAYNVSNKIQFTENTNASGWIQRKEVIEYNNTGGTRSYYNNYTINASKSGYVTDNNVWNFTIQQNKIDDFFTLGATETNPPVITFEEPPTPANTSVTKNPITIVANISDASNTSALMDLDRTLLGYWAMDYYNTTGVYDNSSWNNFAAFANGESSSNITTGPRGDALTFDGLTSDLNIQNNFAGPTNFTMSAWINVRGTHKNYDGAIITSGDWNTNHWSFSVIQDNSGLRSRDPSASVAYTFTPGTWYHVAQTRNGTNLTYYVNGVYVGSSTVSAAALISGYTNTMIGRETYVGGYFAFNGTIDEVAFFNRTLSPVEMKALYSSQIYKLNTSILNLTDGTHNYTVYAIDEYGNTAKSGWRNFTIDTTNPTITFEEPPTPINASSNSTNPITIVANISDNSNTSAWIDFDRTLMGYWAMDYYNSTVIYDNSTYKNNGTFTGGLNYSNLTTGARGQALEFDGGNDYINVPDSASLKPTDAITISIWVKPEDGKTNLIDKYGINWSDSAEWTSGGTMSWDGSENALKIDGYSNTYLSDLINIDTTNGYYLEYDIKHVVLGTVRTSYSGTHSYQCPSCGWLPGHPGSYDYFCDAGYSFTNNTWTHRKNNVISGGPRTGESDNTGDYVAWHNTTRYATVMFLFNYPGAGQTTYLQNLSFYENETGVSKRDAYELVFSNSTFSGKINNSRIKYSLPNNNQWNHLVMTYNRSLPMNQQKLYLNGVLVNQSNLSVVINTSTSNLTFYLNGSLDEVLIFNRSLSETEILALYNSKSNKLNTSAINVTDGQHNYTVYAIDEAGNTANSGWRYFILGGGCTYSSGNWNINCSQYCNITSNVDVLGNNISIIGVGTVTVSANVSNYMNLHINGENSVNICRVRCINGGCFKN
jgi:parallel beta-helix repeat protein